MTMRSRSTVSQQERDALNAHASQRRQVRREARRDQVGRTAYTTSSPSKLRIKRKSNKVALYIALTAFACVFVGMWIVGIILVIEPRATANTVTVIGDASASNGSNKQEIPSAQAAVNHRISDNSFLDKFKHGLLQKEKQLMNLAKVRGGTNDNQQQQVQEQQLQAPAHRKITVVGNPNEVIDMREMARTLPFDDPDGGAWKQGWDVSPVPLDPNNPLKIFIVPHSHCDPGWIKTFDEYFQTQTKQILSSVIKSLAKNPKRKFIWAEISYFEWWWREQPQAVRDTTRKLLASGQFEFVTGGWVQPDEANTQLYAMEIQLQEGHDFIRETFGEGYVPKYGWSIDPFGYSPTMAYLLKKYKFEGMLIQRVHYAVKKELAIKKNLEFMWRQTWDNSGEHDIFTHTMPFFSYDVPHTCGPDPNVCCQFDFARAQSFMNRGRENSGGFANYGSCPWGHQPQQITPQNVKERALLLLDQYRKKASLYRSNAVIAPLGDDFRYQSVEEADFQYENYQMIFDYINENVPGVSIQFGTLSEYFETAMSGSKPPILKGSFFTYADREQDYWSGYFTSRIFDKALDRKLERVLYAANGMGYNRNDLQSERRALSLFQHHDGVTGTAKHLVVKDYARRIHASIHSAQTKMTKYLVDTVPGLKDRYSEDTLQACWQSTAPRGLSQNLCESINSQAQVVLYNPLETKQSCGDIVIEGRAAAVAALPCELAGPAPSSTAGIQFDEHGLMTHPIREEWMVWKVKRGGAYLFFPGNLEQHGKVSEADIKDDGYIMETPGWKRTVVEKHISTVDGSTAVVIDFIYETFLQNDNEEWLVRFSSNIKNEGVFHTDLNGFNFDTHHFRDDMPIQSQVFPMPTHACIQDSSQRMTILSEHAQGTASLKDGSIDVWLDRRLAQDDSRGLAQGVTDNVPTRTRLRVVLEQKGYDHTKPEFEISRLTKQMWKELNHPLEMFGQVSGSGDLQLMDNLRGSKRLLQESGKQVVSNPQDHGPMQLSFDEGTVPFVYMVFNRPEYLKQAIESLRDSDYPRDKVPIVISHDGRVPDVVEYVESLIAEGEFDVLQIFHPFSCTEHPDSFPGPDPKLNEGYKGDSYGHPRDGKITCCKHHFTWLLNQVFTSKKLSKAMAFHFLEEDYIVGPNVYSSLMEGFRAIARSDCRDDYFGVTPDASDGYTNVAARRFSIGPHRLITKFFVTGPMAFDRIMFQKIKSAAKAYCTFDDYNWDWTLVHLMALNVLPAMVVAPSIAQVAHIGLKGGMHESANKRGSVRVAAAIKAAKEGLKPFKLENSNVVLDKPNAKRHAARKGYGGWGHPADHKHCIEIFEGAIEPEPPGWLKNHIAHTHNEPIQGDV